MNKRRVEKRKTQKPKPLVRGKQYPGAHGKSWIGWSNLPGRTSVPATFAATAILGIFTGNVTGLDVTNCQLYSQAARVALPTHSATTL